MTRRFATWQHDPNAVFGVYLLTIAHLEDLRGATSLALALRQSSSSPSPSRIGFHFPSPAVAQVERNTTDHSERAIDQPPVKRNTPNRATDECQRHHHGAGDHSLLDHPDVADRIFERSDEQNRNHQVSESEPIVSVKEEWEPSFSCEKSIANGNDPSGESRVVRRDCTIRHAEPMRKRPNFCR